MDSRVAFTGKPAQFDAMASTPQKLAGQGRLRSLSPPASKAPDGADRIDWARAFSSSASAGASRSGRVLTGSPGAASPLGAPLCGFLGAGLAPRAPICGHAASPSAVLLSASLTPGAALGGPSGVELTTAPVTGRLSKRGVATTNQREHRNTTKEQNKVARGHQAVSLSEAARFPKGGF